MPTERRCDRCKWWDKGTGAWVGDNGQCRQCPAMIGGWPWTNPDDWCSHFKVKEQPDADAE